MKFNKMNKIGNSNEIQQMNQHEMMKTVNEIQQYEFQQENEFPTRK
jgi:hypothetical protein